MHSRIRAYGVTLAALLALAVALPAGLAARPKPGVTPAGGFRIFGRSLGAATVNRIYCGLLSTGKVCADSTNSSTIPGGFWPKGTGNQYVFNSGMQFGGVIDAPSFAWNNDTTGAFFFDARGDLSHGEEVQPIFNHSNTADAASWPDAARVPANDRGAGTFFPLLQGQEQASQGDIWFLTWDGDPAFNAGRRHPLGVLVETRMMGWNYPTGNNDILYLVYTFYNISSTCSADYAGVRPSLQAILLQQAAIFQAKNNAAFGVTIPTCGYNIKNFYANFAADMDVTPDAGHNYASVNIPFKLGYIYSSYFSQNSSATGYPADIDAAPFMGGYGFVGVKYLASPDSGTAPNTGPTGLTLFSDTENGGVFGDPANAIQLYRYMSGTVNPALGDGQCNHNPVTSHICHVEVSQPNDMRFFEASGPFNLPAGGSGSVVVAYIFASPVKYGPCQVASPGAGIGTCGNLNPGDPEKLSNLDSLQNGTVNVVDHLTGFVSYNRGAETVPQQANFNVVNGSLLGKANLAQLVFDNKFLLPFAPNAPSFFLVPGDNQVSVLWRPSTTETIGDLFYSVAHNPVTAASTPNPLYDPNYRSKDVEGYRIYRGRNQGDLHLLVQFDYAGTFISDYNGQVNPVPTCAPELGIDSAGIGADSTCGGRYDKIQPGVAQVNHIDVPLVSPLVQVAIHTGRVALANGTAYITAADTAVTGTASGKFPPLKDTNVPFVYKDNTALNNIRYFYAVTAFDVNSIQSGPSSLESPRNPQAVTPEHAASNFSSTATFTQGLYGRGATALNTSAPMPTLDPATGKFSGPMPPADPNGWSIGFDQFVSTVVQGSGAFKARLDSIQLGFSAQGIPATYWFTAGSGTNFVKVALPIAEDFTVGDASAKSAPFPAVAANLSGRYSGSAGYALQGAVGMHLAGSYYTGLQGRGAVLKDVFDSTDNAWGPRWFDGPSPANNETKVEPNKPVNDTTFNNAGQLTGVTKVYRPMAYSNLTGLNWRGFEAMLGGAVRAADFNVYWGAGGVVDSVVDITHNVLVPFDTLMGGTWGILNNTPTGAGQAGSADGRSATLTVADWACVYPAWLNPEPGVFQPVCSSAQPFKLDSTAQLNFVALFKGATSGASGAARQVEKGFGFYLAGEVFFMTMPALPAAGTVWSMRSYVGAILGGTAPAPSYTLSAQNRTLSAVGAELRINFTVANVIKPTVAGDLAAVHTVPDPYYVTDAYEVSPTSKVIKFVNLPQRCTVRIYSTSGILVRILDHNSSTLGGSENWDVRNRNNQVVASGVYFYSVESATGPRVVKRLTIVNFSQ